MQDAVKDRLLGHISQSFPELVEERAEENAAPNIREWVESAMMSYQEAIGEGQPAYIAEQLSMEELVGGLGPSRFLYVLSVLEEEFEDVYQELFESGVLRYEAWNMVKYCEGIFSPAGSGGDWEEDRFLRYAVIGALASYLEDKQ